MSKPASTEETLHVLVTGANSGLGFATCCRLIDEFLQTQKQSVQLKLIFTTRDRKKSDDTLRRLQKHLKKTLKRRDAYQHGISKLLEPRVQFQPELVDLTSLRSVHLLAQNLRASVPHLDRAILNAGIGGWSGIDWPRAIWTIITGFPASVTWPEYKIGRVGSFLKAQSASSMFTSGPASKTSKEEPVLGEVFCANVFGHYLLVHLLLPIIVRSLDPRIIWVSSIEPIGESLNLPDIQGLTIPRAYESSKRLTDILVLTSRLPSTAPWTNTFFSSSGTTNSSLEQADRPLMYLSHPGITATSIIDLNPVLRLLMIATFYLARLVGSPWHTVSPYLGACSAVWLALTPFKTVDTLERREGVAKWGSASDWAGNPRVQRTEVDGWGFGGVPGDAKAQGRSLENAGARRGRRKGAEDLTPKAREQFEQLGVQCWQLMEEMRLEWERILGLDLNSAE